jgi:hypothetical protein
MDSLSFATADQFSKRLWRLNNLYFIADKQGRRVKFQMNSAQEARYREMHNQNVILKARQRGFTTFIQLFMLDVPTSAPAPSPTPCRTPR